MERVEKPFNEADNILLYAPGTPERQELLEALQNRKGSSIELPLLIGGRKVWTDRVIDIPCPHDRSRVLARACVAGKKEMALAVEAALTAHRTWSTCPWEQRSAVFKRAADLLAGPNRLENIAAIMLNLSKTPFEAEIDLAELVDFWRFNVFFLEQIYRDQPIQGYREINRFDWRPLEGFILAITPFNFYSIAGNLPSAPALCGNTALWKPARSAVLSNYLIMKVLAEAGLPGGVINFLPFAGSEGSFVLEHPDLAGLHFTGSYDTFVKLQRAVGQNMSNYRSFPRIVGETGGKDFLFVHPSADPVAVGTNIIRGGFEYQGQKCSAVSRVYLPESLRDPVLEYLAREIPQVPVGPTDDLEHFMGALIDHAAFEKVTGYIEEARRNPSQYRILHGGNGKDSPGWFVEPTVIETTDPLGKLMTEEIFGPVVTLYIYPDRDWTDTLKICDSSTDFALTGSIFARDRDAILEAERILRFAAGNFYVNDKPTGAVVGRQPFGGSRHSGTNDKAGYRGNLMRWLSPRIIKENTIPARDWRRPFMDKSPTIDKR